MKKGEKSRAHQYELQLSAAREKHAEAVAHLDTLLEELEDSMSCRRVNTLISIAKCLRNTSLCRILGRKATDSEKRQYAVMIDDISEGQLSMGAVVKGPWYEGGGLAKRVKAYACALPLGEHLRRELEEHEEARSAYWDSVAATPWE
jgi:hypothetical protein